MSKEIALCQDDKKRSTDTSVISTGTLSAEALPDPPSHPLPPDPSSIPDGGYGWVCCIACAVTNGFTWGILATYGVYLSYYLDNDIFPGSTSIDYAFIGGANFASAMFVTPLLQPFIRSMGTNAVMLAGSFIYAGGFIAASFATTFWQLVLSQGLCVGLGVGVIWQPSVPILPQWFSRRRSLAQGIASSGSGFIGVIFSLVTTPMIENLSLAWSLRITGIVAWVMLVSAALVIRDRNALIKPKIKPFDLTLLKRYHVLLLLGWSVTFILAYIVLLYSLGSYATSIGLTQQQGSVIIAMQNLGTGLGRPFVGVLSDKLGRITVATALTLFNGVITFAIWIPATNYGVLVFFGLLSGATLGIFWAAIGPLSAEVADLRELPSMLSLIFLVIALPTLFSEAIALELYNPNSGRPYLYPQIYAGVGYLVAAAILFELRRHKIGLFTRERHR